MFTTNITSPTITQMYSQKSKKKRDRLQYKKANTDRAMDIKSEINEIMKDKSLPEDAKSNRYSDLLQEYQLLMAKKVKNSKTK